VIRLIEQKINRFMWSEKDTKAKAKAKISWDKVCFPKSECGLGLRKLDVWNYAVILNHIWNLFIQAGSLWVA
jgi:hypothetical protein